MFLIYEEYPIESIINNENKEIIRSIINKLRPKHALTVRLRYWLDMPSKKIARIIKSTPKSVDVTLFNTRKKIEVEIKKTGFFL